MREGCLSVFDETERHSLNNENIYGSTSHRGGDIDHRNRDEFTIGELAPGAKPRAHPQQRLRPSSLDPCIGPQELRTRRSIHHPAIRIFGPTCQSVSVHLFEHVPKSMVAPHLLFSSPGSPSYSFSVTWVRRRSLRSNWFASVMIFAYARVEASNPVGGTTSAVSRSECQ